MLYSNTARCALWGAAKGARRVSGLTRSEREAVRNGEEVRFKGCPLVDGTTERRIIFAHGRFFARMPKEE
tara:strand:+ start:3397 stop:3606 length:210 start_codon:yes stop_codon:yes gene_type:complete